MGIGTEGCPEIGQQIVGKVMIYIIIYIYIIFIVGYWGHKSLRQPQMVNHPHRLEIMSRRLQLSHFYAVHELLNALVKIGYPKMVTQESLVPWVKHILNSNR